MTETHKAAVEALEMVLAWNNGLRHKTPHETKMVNAAKDAIITLTQQPSVVVMDETVLQIKRAHASAQPKDTNPAWQNCHSDCGKLLAYIDRLSTKDTSSDSATEINLDRYDAGYLSDGGGGDVSWWQDYMRAELERAHEHYQSQVVGLRITRAAATDGVKS